MSEVNQEKRDKDYNNYARIQPAYLSLLFPLIVCFFVYNKYFTDFSNVSVIRYIFDKLVYLGFVTPALFILYRFLLRDISKWFIEKYLFKIFQSPTTSLMQPNNSTFTAERKAKIRQLIFRKFDISINEESNGVKRLDEAVDQIKEVTRSNSILFEYNCIYGFYRNLSAGIFLNFLISIGLLIVNYAMELTYNNILFLLIACFFLLFLILLLLAYLAGLAYAKRLYVVFLSLNHN